MARDPARIERILAKLRTYWTEKYDLRLGQILSNAQADMLPRAPDPFYLEDDLLESWLVRKYPSYVAAKSRENDADHVEQEVERLTSVPPSVETKGRRHE